VLGLSAAAIVDPSPAEARGSHHKAKKSHDGSGRAKEIVRVPPACRVGIEVFEVETRWRDPAMLDNLLRPVLAV
jgi:hypothetical protein